MLFEPLVFFVLTISSDSKNIVEPLVKGKSVRPGVVVTFEIALLVDFYSNSSMKVKENIQINIELS